MIVLAGGSGSRLDPGVNKVYRTVAGRAVLTYSLDTLQRSSVVDRVILVVRPVDRTEAAEAVARAEITKLTATVPGGPTRQESERSGLEALSLDIEAGEIELVGIHDGARPFVTLDLIESLYAAARQHGGAIPVLPLEESLYQRAAGFAEPVALGALVRVQTPQAFAAAPLLAAYRSAALAGFSGYDTAETMERFSNITTAVVAGDPRNIKLTVPEDFSAAEEMAHHWSAGRWK